MAPSIYTGTYPQIKLNPETMKDRSDLKGIGIAGIIIQEDWYCVKRDSNDVYGIGL